VEPEFVRGLLLARICTPPGLLRVIQEYLIRPRTESLVFMASAHCEESTELLQATAVDTTYTVIGGELTVRPNPRTEQACGLPAYALGHGH
jgi:hypothetical protein